MQENFVLSALLSLGYNGGEASIRAIADGNSKVLRGADGKFAALARRGELFDLLAVGANPECPVATLREFLEIAVMPVSEEFAADVGLAKIEREKLRKRIREATVALDVLAKGQKVRVRPADIAIHPKVMRYVESGGAVDDIPDELTNDIGLVNQLEKQALMWKTEMERLSALSNNGLERESTIEEELAFWSSLDAALAAAQIDLNCPAVKTCARILSRNRRVINFVADISNSIHMSRLRAGGVLNLVQSLPIVNLRTSDTEEAVLSASKLFWEHMLAKLPVSSLPVHRVMCLVHAISVEVLQSLTDIQTSRGGLLNVSLDALVDFSTKSQSVFKSWMDFYDRFRKVARDYASRRGERVPERKVPAFVNLRKRIDEAVDFCLHKVALQNVLNKQLDVDYSASQSLKVLEAAYNSAVSQCDGGIALDVSDEANKTWLCAREAYSAATVDIEQSIALHYQETICELNDLSCMAQFASDYTELIDKSFMEGATGTCTSHVLSAASCSVSSVYKRWESYKPTSCERSYFRHLPDACASILQSRMANLAFQEILGNVKVVLGSLRMEYDQDVVELVAKVKAFQAETDQIKLFREWEASVAKMSFQPSCSLLSCKVDDLEIEVGLSEEAVRTLQAVFVFETDLSLRSSLDKGLLRRARDSRFVLQVHSFLSNAVDTYNVTSSLLGNLDDDTLSAVLPLIEERRRKARKWVEKCKALSWTDSSNEQLEAAKMACNECSSYADSVQAAIEEHRNIVFLLDEASTLCVDCETLDRAKEKLADSLGRINSAAKTIRKRVSDEASFRAYLLEVLKPLYIRTFDRALSNSITDWSTKVRMGSVPALQATLRLSTLGERCDVEPEIHVLHSNSLDAMGRVYTAVQELFSKCVTFAADEPVSLVGFQCLPTSPSSECESNNSILAAVKCVENELEKMKTSVTEWSSVSHVLGIDSGRLLKRVSKDPIAADALFVELSSVSEKVNELGGKTSSSGKRSLYLDVSSSCSLLLTNISTLRCDILEACAEFSAQQSHVTYKTISMSKAGIRAAVGKRPVDDFLLINSIQVSVLPAAEQMVGVLARMENAIAATSDISLPSTWIGRDVLEAELSMLKSMKTEKKSKFDVKTMTSRFRREKTAFTESIAAFYKYLESEWTCFASDFEFARSDLDFKSLEPIVSSTTSYLKEEIGRLRQSGIRITSIETALELESSCPDTLLDSLGEKVDNVCDALRRLTHVARRMVEVGKTSFENFKHREIREEVEALAADARALQSDHGESSFVGKVDEIARKHLAMHGLIGKLRECSLSPLREKDVVQQVFGEHDGSVSLMRKSVSDFWCAGLLNKEPYVRHVLELASGESALADFMEGVRRVWTSRAIPFMELDGSRVMDGIPGLLDEIEDQLQSLSTMATSQFVALFEGERKSWESRLTRCYDVLEQTAEVQSQWIHLQSLFKAGESGGSLRRKLQKEFIAFSNVEAQILSFFNELEQSSGLVEGLCDSTELDRMLGDLSEIVRSLSQFLEGQRTSFPRFFFMSDSDLLLTLSVTPKRIDELIPVIGKLFPGISTLKHEWTDTNGALVTSVVSKEGELLSLNKVVSFEEGNSITDFLTGLENGLRMTLRLSLPEAISSLRDAMFRNDSGNCESLVDTVIGAPSQILLLASRVVFTEKVESFFSSQLGSLSEFHSLLSKVLSALCTRSASSRFSENPDGLTLKKLEHIIKEIVYQRRIVSLLLERNVRKSTAYEWFHQVRIYSCDVDKSENMKVMVHCAEAQFVYGWEYLGVGDTLVQTPLTLDCYLSLLHALHRGFGGSPFGPAGTGKTETVKSLGRLLGRYVVVFNCDESFDAVSVGRILAGVARVGFWVCFDEFNRLSSSILSATSQQLSMLQNAVKNGIPLIDNFYGGDSPVTIVDGVGIFITTNPTYTGRRELPGNLKSLFRPCSMSKADSIDIVDVLLLSLGFQSSRSISSRLCHLFECMRRVVRPQSHYDFGLRSLKSCIVIAGYLLSSVCTKPGNATDTGSQREIDEQVAVVLALNESFKPRLVPEDVLEYDTYVRNLFSNVTVHASLLPDDLRGAVLAVCQERNLKLSNVLLERVGQIFNLLQHQPGVIVVGEAGCGKSTAWRVLFGGLRRLSEGNKDSDRLSNCCMRDKVSSLTVLDPKLLSTIQLYGSLDRTTREWTDGVFTKVLRDCALASNTDSGKSFLHWIVFDGDIDPNWVENLNSVLDDTRLLTLPSGERIPLASCVRILFEVDSLSHANPSTVSRCGLVYCDAGEEILDVLSCKLENALCRARVDESHHSVILNLAGRICSFGQSLDTFGVGVLQQPKSFFISQIASNFGSYLNRIERQLSEEILLTCVLFAVKNTVAGKFSSNDGRKLCSSLLEHLLGCSVALDRVIGRCNGETLFYSEFDTEKCTPVSFSALAGDEVVLENLPEDIGSPDIVIPTPTSTRLTTIVRSVLLNQDPIEDVVTVLCGPPGCGKSMVLTAALNATPGIELASISLSSRTSVCDVISVLKAHMELSKGLNGEQVLTPMTPNKLTVLFCDEVNLGEPDDYGTQHVAGFLRFLVENKGFWTNSPPQWTSVKGLIVFAACNPASDPGRHELPSRLMRCSAIVCVEQPNYADLTAIFKVHLSAFLKYLNRRLEPQATALTAAMVDFFFANKERFASESSGPLEPHYVYSARELIRWVRGMKRLLIRPSSADSLDGVIETLSLEELWEEVLYAFSHEAKRLFVDRLVSEDECFAAESLLASVLNKHFGYAGDVVPDILYSTWMNEGSSSNHSSFEKIANLDEFRTFLYRKLRVFAEEEGLGGSWVSGRGVAAREDAIDQFAVTDDVLRHLARIERVLTQPLGHAVLMGVPGTGKKTLARFASWMMGATAFQVRSHASYTADDFANDLRHVLRSAGIHHVRVVVIFDESNDLDSAFLEMMNSILACGDVPGLFEGDDRKSLLKEIQDANHRTGISDVSGDALYAKFLDGVRENLHVVFSIPIVNSQGDRRGVSFDSGSRKDLTSRSPALYNRCVVDWFGDWDEDTLESIADLKLEIVEDTKKSELACTASAVHKIAKDLFVENNVSAISITPRHYLEFIEQFNRIAHEKGDEITETSIRVGEGLAKLRDASAVIDELRESLKEKSIRLTAKEADANATLKTMSEEQRLAEKAKLDAEKLASAAEEAANTARTQQEMVAAELATVEPEVEAAREAVGSISKQNLDELRAMPNPPAHVRTAMDIVLYLLEGASKPPSSSFSWGQIRTRMRASDFISSILNFDITSLTIQAREKMEAKIASTDNFDPDRIQFASNAAGPLARWVEATLNYAAVYETVEPLRQEVLALEEEELALDEQSNRAREDVELLEGRIGEYRSQYASLVAEAERIRSDILDSKDKVGQAESMLDSLSGEWERWNSDFIKCDQDAELVWGNAIYAAAFVAYAGPLDQVLRRQICGDWIQAIKSGGTRFDENLDLSLYLSTPEDRSLWTRQGLSVDGTSLENYAILLRSARYPLVVDPTGKAAELLRNLLGLKETQGLDSCNAVRRSKRSSIVLPSSSKLSVTSFGLTGKKSYARTLESAIRFGATVLVENAERFDNTCLPLLGQESSFGNRGDAVQGQGSIVSSSQQRLVRLGERDIPLSPTFRLFMSATNGLDVSPAAMSRTSVVSFVMSPAALRANCVLRTLKYLHPAIEQQRMTYMVASVAFEERKRELEDSLLMAIQKADDVGKQLMNGELLRTLSSLKSEAGRVEEQEKENKIRVAEGETFEKRYSDLANASLLLYNVLDRLCSLDRLYRFSPIEFFSLFDKSLSRTKDVDCDPAPTSAQVFEQLLRVVFLHVVPTLFPSHKVAFACALVTAAIQFKSDEVPVSFSGADVAHFRSSLISAMQTDFSLDVPAILNSKVYGKLQELIAYSSEHSYLAVNSASPLLEILVSSCTSSAELPKLFDELGSTIPGGRETFYGSQTRPDVVLSNCMKSLVVNSHLNEAESNLSQPMFRALLLCSRGSSSDPCELAMVAARQCDIAVDSIALSDEHSESVMGNIFAKSTRRVYREPHVLLLKNLHVANRKCVERIREELKNNPEGLGYLLVIVAEVGDSASESIYDLAAYCRVLAFEAPPSLRTNLSRCHAVLNASFTGEELLRRCYIAVTWLHGSLLERCQYSPIGFSKSYLFSEGDLVSSWQIVRQMYETGALKNDRSCVSRLVRMLFVTVYGARMDNKADASVLFEFIRDLFDRALSNESGCNVVVVQDAVESKRISVSLDDPLMVESAKSFPSLAPTDWFGMPSSTGRSFTEREGKNILDVFLTLTAARTESNTKSEERSIAPEDSSSRRTILSILELVPELNNSAQVDFNVSSAIERFFLREQLLCVECTQVLKFDLESALHSIDRGTNNTGRLQSLCDAVSTWESIGTAPLPEAWLSMRKYCGSRPSVQSMVTKLRSVWEWVRSPNATERDIDLSCVLRPGSLITTLGLQEADRVGRSVHELKPTLSTGSTADGGEDCIVTGLSITAGKWNNERSFVAASEESEHALPRCQIRWWDDTTRTKQEESVDCKFITLPLYDSLERNYLISEVYIPMDPAVSSSKWVLSATAVVISEPSCGSTQ